MSSQNNTKIEFEKESVTLSVRYDFIIYPIEFSTLKKILELQGYEVPKAVTQNIQQGVGISLEIEGIAGKKEGLVVSSISDKQVITVGSNSVDKALSAFDELEKTLSTELGEDLRTKAKFYETIIHFVLKTGKNPLEVMANMRKGLPYYEKMAKILGTDVAPFSFRFTPAGVPIESEDWFDFKIEPLINRATSTYYANLTLRSKSRDKVIQAIKDIKNKISESVKIMESQ